jgi:large subunit ribosomal protein L21
MFAVIKSGGRQYKVSVGERLEVNRLPVEPGEQVTFDQVLLISDADTTMVGAPLVENAFVLATAEAQARGKKVIVFKYKPKKRYRHRRGHRQEITVLTIDDIVANGKSLITGEAPQAKQPTVEEEVEEALAEPAEELEEGAPTAETEEVAETAETTETPETGSETEEPGVEPGSQPRTRRRRTARNEEEA